VMSLGSSSQFGTFVVLDFAFFAEIKQDAIIIFKQKELYELISELYCAYIDSDSEY